MTLNFSAENFGVADPGYEATAQSFENSFRILQIHTAIQQRPKFFYPLLH